MREVSIGGGTSGSGRSARTGEHGIQRIKIQRIKIQRLRAGRALRRAGALAAVAALGIAGGLLGGGRAAHAQQPTVINQPGAATIALRLPAEANRPEGLTANPATGEVFVGTLEAGGSNFLLRFDAQGQLVARLAFGRVPLLGLAFNEADQKVYIAIPASQIQQPSKIQRVPANFAADTAVEDVALVPMLPGSRMTFPDGLAFRVGSGELFFTDAVQGAIFRLSDPSVGENICPGRSDCVATFSQSPLLRAGATGFGVNGIAVSTDGERLLVSNTSSGQFLSLNVSGDPVVATALGAGGVRGADGLTLISERTVAIAASIGDQVVLLDSTSGQRRAVLGSALGVANDGAPRGLSAPASLVRVGNDLLVTNLGTDGAARQIRVPTVVRIPIPEALR